MQTMNAAVVTAFGDPPHYEQMAVPEPTDDREVVVDVVAVGLHPRTRSGAAGTHYSSSRTLPMVPGIDAVGRRPDGKLIYFVAHDDVVGTMADKALAESRRSIELPDDVDAVKVAAAMNPAMSSWVALRRKVPLAPGQSVLVLGATGNAGAMAVQVAKRLGAGTVIGVGRDRARLEALPAIGADRVVALEDGDEALGAAAAEVDLVLDYLWGEPAARAIVAMLTVRSDRSRSVDWIQIGSVAGPTIELPSVALRSANLRVQGVGQGSVSGPAYLAELPSLVDEICSGALRLDTRTESLAEVESVWTSPECPGVRTVLLPNG